jgi:hypothetical protein
MKYISRIANLDNIDYSPLAQNMDTNFLDTGADYLHGFPIAWFESVLNRTELEACCPARLVREISQIIQA